MATETIWTTELVEQLGKLWHDGLSTAEIGRRLGITKNAVVGKAHRLALEPRPSPVKTIPRMRRVVEFAPASCCCWPVGHPGDKSFHFCGAAPVPGKPYCAEHAAIAYIRKAPATAA
jgi:GcrA cell cycle regulator